MGDRFPLALAGGFLLLGALGTFVFRGAARGEFADTLSTYRSEPDGARALYLLAEESGLPVARQHQDLAVVEEGTVPVLLGIEDPWFGRDEDEDDDSILGTAPAPVPGEEDTSESKAVPLTEDERERLTEHLEAGGTVVWVLRNARPHGLATELNVGIQPVDPAFGVRTLQPATPSPYTRGVERLEAKLSALLELPDHGVPLLVDTATAGIVAAEVRSGAGRLILIAAPELAQNAALARADNAQFWLSTFGALASDGRTLRFSEFHHGFTGDRSIASFARRYGLHWACAQLVLGLVFWAASLRRFGRPRPAIEEQRIGGTDALISASRILREGRHHAHAADVLLDGLTQDLARVAGLPPHAKPSWIAESLAHRGRPELAALLRDAKVARGKATTDLGLQHLAELVARARAQAAPTRTNTKGTTR